MRLGTFLAPRLRPLYAAAARRSARRSEPETLHGRRLRGAARRGAGRGLHLRAALCRPARPRGPRRSSRWPRRSRGRALRRAAGLLLGRDRRSGDAARSFDDLRRRRWVYNEPSRTRARTWCSPTSRDGPRRELLRRRDPRRALTTRRCGACCSARRTRPRSTRHLLEVMRADDPYVASPRARVTVARPVPDPAAGGRRGPVGGRPGDARGPPSPPRPGPAGTLVERWVPVTDADYDPIRAMRDEAAALAPPESRRAGAARTRTRSSGG